MPHPLSQMALTARVVFSNPWYATLAVVIFVVMSAGLLAASEYVFFEPYFVGHVPKGTELGAALIVVVSALSALVVPSSVMSLWGTRKSRRGFAGGLTGTTVGIAAGVCSCGPVGLALVGLLGAAGTAVASFLTVYDVPLRLAAIAALMVSFHTVSSSFMRNCKTPL